MSNWSTLYVTDIGKQEMAELIAQQKPLKFTRFGVGKGEVTVAPRALSDMVERVRYVNITDYKREDTRITLSGRVSNDGNLEGYRLRELGVYIEGADGNEVLYAYLVDDEPNFFPAQNIRIVDVPIDVTLIISDMANVSVELDLKGRASIEYVNNKLEEVYQNVIQIDDIYPIGNIYLSVLPTDPGLLFKGTQWEKLPSGRMLLAEGDEYEALSMGGEVEHKLTIDEMPAHIHDGSVTTVAGAHKHEAGSDDASWQAPGTQSQGAAYLLADKHWSQQGVEISNQLNNHAHKTLTTMRTAGDHTHGIQMSYKGGNKAHNNMPPYLAVYMWKRIA